MLAERIETREVIPLQGQAGPRPRLPELEPRRERTCGDLDLARDAFSFVSSAPVLAAPRQFLRPYLGLTCQGRHPMTTTIESRSCGLRPGA